MPFFENEELLNHPLYQRYAEAEKPLRDQRQALMETMGQKHQISGQDALISAIQAALPMVIGGMINGGAGIAAGGQAGSQAATNYLQFAKDAHAEDQQQAALRLQGVEKQLEALTRQRMELEKSAVNKQMDAQAEQIRAERDQQFTLSRDEADRQFKRAEEWPEMRVRAGIGNQGAFAGLLQEQIQTLDKLADSDPVIKDATLRMADANEGLRMLANPNSITDPQAIRKLARMVEKGVLSDKDVAAMVPENVRTDLRKTINYLTSADNPQLTPSQRQLMINAFQFYRSGAQESINQRLDGLNDRGAQMFPALPEAQRRGIIDAHRGYATRAANLEIDFQDEQLTPTARMAEGVSEAVGEQVNKLTKEIADRIGVTGTKYADLPSDFFAMKDGKTIVFDPERRTWLYLNTGVEVEDATR